MSNKGSDRFIDWSPDSKSVLYSSDVDDTKSNYYLNSRYFRIDVDGKHITELGKDFDENLGSMTWTDKGIYATAYQKTLRPIFLLNPDNGKVEKLIDSPSRIYSLSATDDGKKIACTGEADNLLSEIYIYVPGNNNTTKITDLTDQISNWKYSDPEVISWKSKDGTTIEGVLHKPMDYDPGKKYPLLVNIHGGPTSISVPGPAPSYVYPVLQ